MRNFVGLSALILGVVGQQCSLKPGQDCFGSDIGNTGASNAQDCCNKCHQNSGCTGFAYKDGVCYMKSSCSNFSPDGSVTAGTTGNHPNPSPPPSGGGEYCPDPAQDFWEEVEGPWGELTWGPSGWTIKGQRRVSSKASFDLRGGYIEADMDLSGAHGGVNTNFYLAFPRKTNCGIGCYCDSGATGGCREIDITENNGHCYQATTWHSDPWGGDKNGHGGSGYIGARIHIRASFDNNGGASIQIGDNHYGDSGYADTMAADGAVLYSSQWVGWVPGNCGGDGNLNNSQYTVSNLKIKGRVLKGPEPKKCDAVKELAAPKMETA